MQMVLTRHLICFGSAAACSIRAMLLSNGQLGLDALKDQIAAGAFMLCGSVVFLVPAIYLTARLLTNGQLLDVRTGTERPRAMAQ